MNNIRLKIWDREFELPINYEIIGDESMTDNQKKALDLFLEETSIINDAKKELDEYVIKNNDNGLKEMDNIFKYVIPRCLYVPESDKGSVIVLVCNYKFDLEHGLVLVFENNQLNTIGPEDIIA